MTETPFESLKISQQLIRAVKDMGYENATEIQALTIPLILEGKDIIGRSHTGTGKTAAFGIPAIELIDGANKSEVQVLLLCPTRELAMQAWGEMKKLYKYKTGVKAAVVYGGQNIEKQIKELKRGVNIIIGTPGRIMDHMRRRTIKLANVKMVILDEADEMLNMGFREDIETILNDTPKDRRTILFSATMPPEILAITKIYQNQPQLIETTHNEVTLKAIEQLYCEAPLGKKGEALTKLLDMYKPKLSIVFCNTQRMVDELCEYLNDKNYPAAGIHGNMRQNARTNAMESFKSGVTALLVATDVAARGIDAQDVEAVINFDVPPNTEQYVHRIGRTGRIGKPGRAFTIVSGKKQSNELRIIERETKEKMGFVDVQVAGHALHLNKKPDDADYPFKGPSAFRESNFDSAARDTKINKAPNTPKLADNIKDRNIAKSKSRLQGETVKIELNLGKQQFVAPNHIVGAITERTGLTGGEIGKIIIDEKRSVVEIPAASKQEVLEAMNGSKIKGLFVGAKLHEEDKNSATKKSAFGGRERFNRKPKAD